MVEKDDLTQLAVEDGIRRASEDSGGERGHV